MRTGWLILLALCAISSPALSDMLTSISDCRQNEVFVRLPEAKRQDLARADNVVDQFIYDYSGIFKYKCFQGVEYEFGELNEESSAYEYHFGDIRTGRSVIEIDVVDGGQGALVIGELEHVVTPDELERLLPTDVSERIRRIFEQDCRSIYEIELSERDFSGTHRPFSNPRRSTLLIEYGCTLPSGLSVESKIPLSAIYALK